MNREPLFSRSAIDWFWFNRPGESGRPYLRVHAVSVYVRDQDRSLHFYLDQLGFQLGVDVGLPGGDRWIVVSPPDGSALLALLKPAEDSEEYQRIGQLTGVVFVTDDIDARFREWSKRGVSFTQPPAIQPWGGTAAGFEDVDGNRFGLIGFDEITKALEAERHAVAEKLETERRSAHEMAIAKEVQAGLFPQRLPPLETLTYSGTCIQARQVGGDYYDFLDLGPGRLGLVVADVAGKGIAAALLMSNLQANLRSQYAVALDDLERLLKSANRLFYENTPDTSYATLFFAEYEDQGRRLRYVNCGHLPPLLLRLNQTLERLESTCRVVGMFANWECSVGEIRLLPGDTLVLYSDGVTEAMSDEGEEFGEERLIEVLRAHAQTPAPDLLRTIVDTIHQFSGREQEDDITLVVAQCQ
jgi:serine phosphatase RsbU (regulator of sigma subunit)/predicted enzyme related to lactoylglutathione lyase